MLYGLSTTVCAPTGQRPAAAAALILLVRGEHNFLCAFILSFAKNIWPPVVAIQKCSKWCKIDDILIFFLFLVSSPTFHEIIFFIVAHLDRTDSAHIGHTYLPQSLIGSLGSSRKEV